MEKDRTVVCPFCGSKKITKKIPTFQNSINKPQKIVINSIINSMGYYWCKNCKTISTTHEVMPKYKFDKIKVKYNYDAGRFNPPTPPAIVLVKSE